MYVCMYIDLRRTSDVVYELQLGSKIKIRNIDVFDT